jgi:hypothetical protein
MRAKPSRCHLFIRREHVRAAIASAGLLLTALTASPVHAQFVELDPGTRIRLRAPAAVAGQLTGVVIARSRDSLTVSRSSAMPVTLPITGLTSLEISRGKSHGRGAAKGALWGGGVLAVLGLVIPMDDCPEETSSATCSTEGSRAEGVLWAATSGALTGALIGGIVGAERWERATLPLQLGVRPLSSGGVRVAVRWER